MLCGTRISDGLSCQQQCLKLAESTMINPIFLVTFVLSSAPAETLQQFSVLRLAAAMAQDSLSANIK